VRELRREHFGSDAEALFGEEEQTVRVALERRRIARDPSLSPEEKQQRIAAAEEALPADVRESRELARSALESKKEVDALRARGASDQEIWAARERRFGAEAADRLAALDTRRADWQRRVAGYRDARAALEREPGFAALAPAQREARIEALRAQHFSGTELLRVRALDAEHAAARP
jgi:lipase chaperone LimK